MNILEELFESKARIRIMKLFYKNEEEQFEKKELITRTKLKEPQVRKELNLLSKIGFLRSRSKKGEKLYTLDESFPFHNELKEIILKDEFTPDKEMVSSLKKVGKVSYAVIAGELINNLDAEVDLFIVCENINEERFNDLVKTIEAEIGKELRFSTMNEEEFMYRCDMFDRFTIELLRNPHREIINNIPRLPKQLLKASRSKR